MTVKHVVKATCFDRRGRILSVGFNSYTKTHPLMAFFGKMVGITERTYIHAELAALVRCSGKLPARIHIERYRKDGTPGNAKPCSICEKALQAWGVSEITYTTSKEN